MTGDRETIRKNAVEAYSRGDLQTAERCCQLLLTQDETDSRAWLMLGKAVGWQSSDENNRFADSMKAFAKAIRFAPDSEKQLTVNQAAETVIRVAVAMTIIHGNNFALCPDTAHMNCLTDWLVHLTELPEQFYSQTGIYLPVENALEPSATAVDQAVAKAYGSLKAGQPGFAEGISCLITLLECTVTLCEGDDDGNLQRYQNLILLHDRLLKDAPDLSEEARALCHKKIKLYGANIKELAGSQPLNDSPYGYIQ